MHHGKASFALPLSTGQCRSRLSPGPNAEVASCLPPDVTGGGGNGHGRLGFVSQKKKKKLTPNDPERQTRTPRTDLLSPPRRAKPMGYPRHRRIPPAENPTPPPVDVRSIFNKIDGKTRTFNPPPLPSDRNPPPTAKWSRHATTNEKFPKPPDLSTSTAPHVQYHASLRVRGCCCGVGGGGGLEAFAYFPAI